MEWQFTVSLQPWPLLLWQVPLPSPQTLGWWHRRHYFIKNWRKILTQLIFGEGSWMFMAQWNIRKMLFNTLTFRPLKQFYAMFVFGLGTPHWQASGIIRLFELGRVLQTWTNLRQNERETPAAENEWTWLECWQPMRVSRQTLSNK